MSRLQNSRWLQIFLTFLAVLLLDIISKAATYHYFQPWEHSSQMFPFGGMAIFQLFGIDFCIHHVTNRGIAWGIGERWQELILVLRIVLVLGLLVYLVLSKKTTFQKHTEGSSRIGISAAPKPRGLPIVNGSVLSKYRSIYNRLAARVFAAAQISILELPSIYALTLLTVGGLGNILDYFIYGHVIDMFHFIFWGYSYPVFNVADIAIFCGIMALLWQSFKRKDVLSQA